MIDLNNLIELMKVLYLAFRGVLSLTPIVFSSVYEYQGSLHFIPFWILLIAGISKMLGQSVVLFANRVNKVRFWFSILLGALFFVLDILVVTTVFWLLASAFGKQPFPYLETTRAIAMAYAPYWLSFLVLIPHFGQMIEKVLNLWVFLAFIVACQTIFGVDFLHGVIGALVALLIDKGSNILIGRWLTPLTDKMVFLVSGMQERKTARELYEEFAALNISDEGLARTTEESAAL